MRWQLMAVLERVDAVLPGGRLAHEVAQRGLEALLVRVPPPLNLRRVRPEQAVIGIHREVLILGIFRRPEIHALGQLTLQLEVREVQTSNESEGFVAILKDS
jgi:hypothetical protein